MRGTLETERARGLELAGSATSLDDLESAQTSVMGRRSAFSEVQRGLGSLSEDERRALGKEVNETRQVLAAAFEQARDRLTREAAGALLVDDLVDLSLPGRRSPSGSLHPLTIVEDQIVDVFLRLGFRVVEGPEIEDDWHNFQALNIPEDHPARTMKDSLYVAIPGHPELLLRTETSAVQIRTMQSQPPPVYVIAPGRVYRRETPDATHLPVFYQTEGLVVDEGITFADLKGTLEAMAGAVRCASACTPRSGVLPVRRTGGRGRCRAASSATVRGAASVATAGSSCSARAWCTRRSSRIAGTTRGVRRFAFGVGIERIALLRYAIPDMRMFVDGDVRFLAQFGTAS